MTIGHYEYKGEFDESIYGLILHLSRLKGIDGSAFTNDEFIEEIRDSIISIANNYHLDLSIPPEKEYHEGDKVSLYYGGVLETARIIKIGYGDYGLLLEDRHMVVYASSQDSATNYIIELQKIANIKEC